MLIGLLNVNSCSGQIYDGAYAVRIIGTNFVAEVPRQFLTGVDVSSGNTTSGNTTPPKKGKPKKTLGYPFQLGGLSAGVYTLGVGTVLGYVGADQFGNPVSFPAFHQQNTVEGIVVPAGGVVNLGTVNVDPSCPGEPTDVCGNGIDENGNGVADENCPCSGPACATPPVCDDLGLVTCDDGTCRSSLSACPQPYVPPPADSCDGVTCQKGYVCSAGSCVAGNSTPPAPDPAPAPAPGPGGDPCVALPNGSVCSIPGTVPQYGVCVGTVCVPSGR